MSAVGGWPEDPAHASWMGLALAQAALATATGDVPVGAVVLSAEGGCWAPAVNRREADGDPTAHAEVLALRAAAARPRRMASGRVHARRDPGAVRRCAPARPCSPGWTRLVFGAWDPKAGAAGSVWDLRRATAGLNHRVEVVGGVRERGVLAASLARFLRRDRRARVTSLRGGVSERPKEHASKACEGATPPWVQIPPPPPDHRGTPRFFEGSGVVHRACGIWEEQSARRGTSPGNSDGSHRHRQTTRDPPRFFGGSFGCSIQRCGIWVGWPGRASRTHAWVRAGAAVGVVHVHDLFDTQVGERTPSRGRGAGRGRRPGGCLGSPGRADAPARRPRGLRARTYRRRRRLRMTGRSHTFPKTRRRPCGTPPK